MQKKFRWYITTICLCGLGLLGYLGKEIKVLKRKNKSYNRFFVNVEKGYTQSTPRIGSMAIPAALQNVPFANETGLVLNTIKVSIRGVQAPYNASMIEQGDGYLLFFRYDIIDSKCPGPFYTYIGCVKLDAHFQQTHEEFKRIDTGSRFSEDPRIVKIGNDLYLIFNDVDSCGINCRTMRIGLVNLEESKLDFVTNLDMQIKNVEKNWVPFEYIENGKPNLYLEYYLSPHKILKLPDPSVSEMIHLPSPSHATYQKLYWPPIWGLPRGGATARKVDNQYLSFFHSSFTDLNGSVWYIMGAYTFDDFPPFRVNALSNYPILFKDIYDTPPMNTADAHKRIIFPGSFLIRTWDEKEVIHLVCGENDCAIKIVTLDKQALLKSMKRI